MHAWFKCMKEFYYWYQFLILCGRTSYRIIKLYKIESVHGSSIYATPYIDEYHDSQNKKWVSTKKALKYTSWDNLTFIHTILTSH